MRNTEERSNGEQGRPAGGGKVLTERSQQGHAKPYDRPSFLGRVCSAFKDILKPVYFTDNFSKLNSKPEENVHEDNNVEGTTLPGGRKNGDVSNPNEIDSYCTTLNSAVPLRGADVNATVDLERRPLQSFKTPLYRFESTSMANPSSGLTSTPHRFDSHTALPSTIGSIHRCQSSRMYERDVNASASSESASSGFKSGVRKFPTAKVTRTTWSDINVSQSIVPTSNDTFLWSSQQNDAQNSKRQSFDVSTFHESIDQTRCSDVTKTSAANKSVASRMGSKSLFYAGETTYGGAAAARMTNRNQLSSSPYQRRGAVQQLVTAKPSGALGDKGVTSATTLRMLNAMQRGQNGPSSIRNNGSHHTSGVTASLSIIPSASIYHRHSAQYDPAVQVDSLFANGFRASHGASEGRRESVSIIPNNFQSNVTYSESAPQINAAEAIKEHPLECGGKMKKPPKHYSCRNADEITGPNPLLSTIQPLPSINMNPGLLCSTTSPTPAVSFAFSMPKENVVEKTAPSVFTDREEIVNRIPAVNNRVGFKVPSVSNNDTRSYQDYQSSTTLTSNSFQMNGISSRAYIAGSNSDTSVAATLPSPVPLAALFKKSTNTWKCTKCLVDNANEEIACVGCSSRRPGSVPTSCGVKSADDQSEVPFVTQPSTSAGAVSFNSSEVGGFKFGSQSNIFETKNCAKNHSDGRLPNIIEDDTLSRPPLRNGASLSINAVVTTSFRISGSVSGMSLFSSTETTSVPFINSIACPAPDSSNGAKSYDKLPVNSTSTVLSSSVTQQGATEGLVIKPLSELFRKSVNVWTCDECYVANKSDVNVCVSCETVRAGDAPPPTVPTVIEDVIRLPISSACAAGKQSVTSAVFSFGMQNQTIAVTSFGQSSTTASGFVPTSTGLFQFRSVPIQVSSSASDISKNRTIKKQPMFQSPATISPSATSLIGTPQRAFIAAPAVESFIRNTFSSASVLPVSNNFFMSTAPILDISSGISSNTELKFGGPSTVGSNTTPMNGGLAGPVSNATVMFGGASVTTDSMASMFQVIAATTSSVAPVNGVTFGVLPNASASVGNTLINQSPFHVPSIFNSPPPTTTSAAASSLFTTSSTSPSMFGSITSPVSSKFSYIPPAGSVFGNSFASPQTTTFGISDATVAPSMLSLPASTTAASQFCAAVTSSVASDIFSATTTSRPASFFGIPPSTANSTTSGVTAMTTATFGTQAASGNRLAFGTSTGMPFFGLRNEGPQPSAPLPLFGQQPNVLSTDRPVVPFPFGPATTNNSTQIFQISSAVAPTGAFFGTQTCIASATPSGFGTSAFSNTTFGAAKTDSSFPAPIFGIPQANMDFGTPDVTHTTVPSFGPAVGVQSIFGPPSTGNGQPGVAQMFGAPTPATVASFAFGNGMQNSQMAVSSIFAFRGGASNVQTGDPSKMAGASIGLGNKRALDISSNNEANPAKRSSNMFGNATQNAQPFAFGSGLQQSGPPNVWHQQQPSAGANNTAAAFSTTLPSAGFNFGSAASQFHFPATPASNTGGAVFQFGGVANQQPVSNPFNNMSSGQQNPFNVNTPNVAPNPFDVGSSANNASRVMKRGVRRALPKR